MRQDQRSRQESRGGVLTLYREAGVWMADSRLAADAEEVRALFGTYVLPTAYPAEADQEYVLRRLRALNPGVKVVAR